MTSRISIKSNVLKWAILKSNKDFKIIEEKFPKLKSWLSNEMNPTFKQVQSLSSFLNIPFGYLLIDTPPKEDLELLKFRTLNSQEDDNPSRELIDTINDMKTKQSWMKNYLIEEGYDSNHIVNRLNINQNTTYLADKLRELIDLPINWYEYQRTNVYKYMRNKLSYNGILMMQNGIAKNNTHRPLNVAEFRAFCLIDEYAPLIFINTKDSENGKIFSMLHELAHIGLGTESIFNDETYKVQNEYTKIEAKCNEIAAEILVPNNQFTFEWSTTHLKNNKDKINELSNKFIASNIVIARRALDNKFISKKLYNEVVDETTEILKNYFKPKSSGGNAVNNAKSRLDTNFALAVSDGLKNGRALYSDIYKLAGVKPKMFGKIVESMEEI
ncbi:ImmA/IrrE family metallo-endopeptidase [Staphylococcus saprophyticus]|uniref:ImmA/IrrE family metallo-endopeptidase n=2 Tax=Staphylococcus saprophyticus TaxID=29385 RepID=UPI00280B446A|nr:ImmA/IrrE family metallo-endopeptidase [Staphylococcus saprophyticus]WMM14379.1 ImmA/IrrE family metallo-endopeptidase [Staphylococcus saprophyticus]